MFRSAAVENGLFECPFWKAKLGFFLNVNSLFLSAVQQNPTMAGIECQTHLRGVSLAAAVAKVGSTE